MATPHRVDVTRRRKARRRRIAVVNQKGGSTKTTTAVNLAAALVRLGYRVRIHDMDPQDGSATAWLEPLDEVGDGVLDVYEGGATVDEVTSRTTEENLLIVPSWESMRDIDTKAEAGIELAYRIAVDKSDADVDYELFDCVPNLGKLAVGGMVAADEIIVPVNASALDTKGMAQLFKTFNLVKARLVPDLALLAVVVGRVKPAGFDRKLLAGFEERYGGNNVIVAQISDTVNIREAPDAHETIFTYLPNNRVCGEFMSLAERVDAWELAA